MAMSAQELMTLAEGIPNLFKQFTQDVRTGITEDVAQKAAGAPTGQDALKQILGGGPFRGAIDMNNPMVAAAIQGAQANEQQQLREAVLGAGVPVYDKWKKDMEKLHEGINLPDPSGIKDRKGLENTWDRAMQVWMRTFSQEGQEVLAGRRRTGSGGRGGISKQERFFQAQAKNSFSTVDRLTKELSKLRGGTFNMMEMFMMVESPELRTQYLKGKPAREKQVLQELATANRKYMNILQKWSKFANVPLSDLTAEISGLEQQFPGASIEQPTFTAGSATSAAMFEEAPGGSENPLGLKPPPK